MASASSQPPRRSLRINRPPIGITVRSMAGQAFAIEVAPDGRVSTVKGRLAVLDPAFDVRPLQRLHLVLGDADLDDDAVLSEVGVEAGSELAALVADPESGAFLGQFDGPSDLDAIAFVMPTQVIADTARDRLIVCDAGNHRVVSLCRRTLALVWQFGTPGTSGRRSDALDFPLSCALSGEHASLLHITDSFNNRVVTVRADDGTFMSSFGPRASYLPGHLEDPSGIAVAPPAPCGRQIVWVSNAANEIVECFDVRADARSPWRRMGVLGQPGTRGPGNDRFDHPRALTTGGDLIFVADCRNHRIQVFNSYDGAYVRTIGSGPGDAEGQLNYPRGISVVDDHLYVSDNINRRVCVFSVSTGTFLGVLSTGLDGQLEGLIGLCVARDSVVYVCNFYLNCILMFSAFR